MQTTEGRNSGRILQIKKEPRFLGSFYYVLLTYASKLPVRTASKSSSISFSGALVTREKTTMQMQENINAGSNS